MQPSEELEPAHRAVVVGKPTKSEAYKLFVSEETLIDRGTAAEAEDGIVVNPALGIATVFDGVSGAYTPDEGPKTYYGMTGGQLAGRSLKQAVESAIPTDSLDHVLERATKILADHMKAHDMHDAPPAFLPGVVGVILKFDVENDRLEITSWGDTRASWRLKDGTFGTTREQIHQHDTEMYARIESLMIKHEGDREKMWNEFLPYLIERRNIRLNNLETPKGYGLLNSQPGFLKSVDRYSLKLSDIATLLITTDGAASARHYDDPDTVARDVFAIFESRGINAILTSVRNLEARKKGTTHVDHSEFAALGYRFS